MTKTASIPIFSTMLTQERSVPTPGNWKGVENGLKEARIMLNDGDIDQACAMIEEVLEFAPREARAWHALGKARQIKGKHHEALKCFEKAGNLYAQMDDRSVSQIPANTNLVALLLQQGEAQAARNMLGTLMREQGGNPELIALQHKIDQYTV